MNLPSDRVLDRVPAGGRALVIRLRSLGDCVLTTPALAILRRARPDLEIAVMVEDRFAAVFEGSPDVSRILTPSVAAARGFRPHLCLNLHGATRSLMLTLASGAGIRAGFAHFCCPWAYQALIPTAQEILGVDRKVHTAEHLASAMFFLGAPRQEVPAATVIARGARAARPYAVLHPMASAPAKTWPAGKFLAVAEQLKAHWCLEPVFIAAAGEDAGAFTAHRLVRGAPLSEVKALLAGAALFLGNDSGPAHLAAALGVPAVVLYGPTDAAVWAPWRANAEALVSPAGIERIALDDVLTALDKLRVKA